MSNTSTGLEIRDTVPTLRTLEAGEVSRFVLRGLVADSKDRWCLADLLVPSGGAKGVCPVTAIVGLGSRITAMSEGVAAKLRAMAPDVCCCGHIDCVTRSGIFAHTVRNSVERLCRGYT